tara:strand:- start:114 stop:398 length:285 start_codon:yes stop_codon:yes gene_type:complete
MESISRKIGFLKTQIYEERLARYLRLAAMIKSPWFQHNPLEPQTLFSKTVEPGVVTLTVKLESCRHKAVKTNSMLVRNIAAHLTPIRKGLLAIG